MMNDFRPATDARFGHARPVPSDATLSDEMALAFGPLGLAAIHASLLDAASMSRESSWTIAPDGVQEVDHDLGSARAMATIVHLNPPGDCETIKRRLAPERWVFGWPLDERRVVVAEAHYRAPHEAPSEIDTALVRTLCDARLRLAETAGPTVIPADDVVEVPGAANGQVLSPAAQAPVSRVAVPMPTLPATAQATTLPATQDPPPPGGAGPLPSWRRRRGRLLAAGLLAAAAVAVGLGYLQLHRSDVLTSETQRLQALSEATLTQSLVATLERGDYGELQFDLDRFEKLRYFDAAVVANARGQVVAKTESARGVRVGETIKPESVSGSRSIELRHGSAPVLGRAALLAAPRRELSGARAGSSRRAAAAPGRRSRPERGARCFPGPRRAGCRSPAPKGPRPGPRDHPAGTCR